MYNEHNKQKKTHSNKSKPITNVTNTNKKNQPLSQYTNINSMNGMKIVAVDSLKPNNQKSTKPNKPKILTNDLNKENKDFVQNINRLDLTTKQNSNHYLLYLKYIFNLLYSKMDFETIKDKEKARKLAYKEDPHKSYKDILYTLGININLESPIEIMKSTLNNNSCYEKFLALLNEPNNLKQINDLKDIDDLVRQCKIDDINSRANSSDRGKKELKIDMSQISLNPYNNMNDNVLFCGQSIPYQPLALMNIITKLTSAHLEVKKKAVESEARLGSSTLNSNIIRNQSQVVYKEDMFNPTQFNEKITELLEKKNEEIKKTLNALNYPKETINECLLPPKSVDKINEKLQLYQDLCNKKLQGQLEKLVENIEQDIINQARVRLNIPKPYNGEKLKLNQDGEKIQNTLENLKDKLQDALRTIKLDPNNTNIEEYIEKIQQYEDNYNKIHSKHEEFCDKVNLLLSSKPIINNNNSQFIDKLQRENERILPLKDLDDLYNKRKNISDKIKKINDSNTSDQLNNIRSFLLSELANGNITKKQIFIKTANQFIQKTLNISDDVFTCDNTCTWKAIGERLNETLNQLSNNPTLSNDSKLAPIAYDVIKSKYDIETEYGDKIIEDVGTSEPNNKNKGILATLSNNLTQLSSNKDNLQTAYKQYTKQWENAKQAYNNAANALEKHLLNQQPAQQLTEAEFDKATNCENYNYDQGNLKLIQDLEGALQDLKQCKEQLEALNEKVEKQLEEEKQSNADDLQKLRTSANNKPTIDIGNLFHQKITNENNRPIPINDNTNKPLINKKKDALNKELKPYKDINNEVVARFKDSEINALTKLDEDIRQVIAGYNGTNYSQLVNNINDIIGKATTNFKLDKINASSFKDIQKKIFNENDGIIPQIRSQLQTRVKEVLHSKLAPIAYSVIQSKYDIETKYGDKIIEDVGGNKGILATLSNNLQQLSISSKGDLQTDYDNYKKEWEDAEQKYNEAAKALKEHLQKNLQKKQKLTETEFYNATSCEDYDQNDKQKNKLIQNLENALENLKQRKEQLEALNEKVEKQLEEEQKALDAEEAAAKKAINDIQKQLVNFPTFNNDFFNEYQNELGDTKSKNFYKNDEIQQSYKYDKPGLDPKYTALLADINDIIGNNSKTYKEKLSAINDILKKNACQNIDDFCEKASKSLDKKINKDLSVRAHGLIKEKTNQCVETANKKDTNDIIIAATQMTKTVDEIYDDPKFKDAKTTELTNKITKTNQDINKLQQLLAQFNDLQKQITDELQGKETLSKDEFGKRGSAPEGIRSKLSKLEETLLKMQDLKSKISEETNELREIMQKAAKQINSAPVEKQVANIKLNMADESTQEDKQDDEIKIPDVVDNIEDDANKHHLNDKQGEDEENTKNKDKSHLSNIYTNLSWLQQLGNILGIILVIPQIIYKKIHHMKISTGMRIKNAEKQIKKMSIDQNTAINNLKNDNIIKALNAGKHEMFIETESNGKVKQLFCLEGIKNTNKNPIDINKHKNPYLNTNETYSPTTKEHENISKKDLLNLTTLSASKDCSLK